MAVPGPSSRTYSIDNSSGTPTDWSTLIVGSPDLGNLEEILHDLTGPSDVAPEFLPVGFSKPGPMKFVFQADVGGSSPADPTTEFMVTNRTTSRTILITVVSGWTYGGEAFITTCTPKTDAMLKSLLEVGFTPTGTWTVT